MLVKGKAEVLEEGKARLLVTEVLPLEQAKLAEARYVTIRVPVPAWDRAKGERLRDILGAHRGECPVTLELVRPGAFAVAVAPERVLRCGRTRRCAREVEAPARAGRAGPRPDATAAPAADCLWLDR